MGDRSEPVRRMRELLRGFEAGESLLVDPACPVPTIPPAPPPPSVLSPSQVAAGGVEDPSSPGVVSSGLLCAGVLSSRQLLEKDFDWAFEETCRVLGKLGPSDVIILGDAFGMWVARACDVPPREVGCALPYRLVGCPRVPSGVERLRSLSWFEADLVRSGAVELIELEPDCVENRAAAVSRVVVAADVLVLVCAPSVLSSFVHDDVVHVNYLDRLVQRVV